MTVCVAAVNFRGDIVAASAQMLSMAGVAFTPEIAAMKTDLLTIDWEVMFAGEDVGVIPSMATLFKQSGALGRWSYTLSRTIWTCRSFWRTANHRLVPPEQH